MKFYEICISIINNYGIFIIIVIVVVVIQLRKIAEYWYSIIFYSNTINFTGKQ